MDVGPEAFEMAGHNQVGEGMIHHIDRHATVSSALQLIFEFLANQVIFPDVRLKENTPLCLANGMKHCLVEVLAIRVDLYDRVANRNRLRLRARKMSLWSIAFAPGIDRNQHANHKHLQTKKHQQRPQQHTTQHSRKILECPPVWLVHKPVLFFFIHTSIMTQNQTACMACQAARPYTPSERPMISFMISLVPA